MSIKLRKQTEDTVETPSSFYVQFFIDTDGLPKLKDSNGIITPIGDSEFLALQEQGVDPDFAANQIRVYAKEVGGVTELFTRDSDGSVVQLTSDGLSLAGALKTATGKVIVGPADAPTTGQVLTATSATTAEWQDAGSGDGDVVGPVSSVDNNVVAFDGLTGKLIQDTGIDSADLILEGDSRLTNARTPTAHASSHENDQPDEIDVTGLSGVLADPQLAGSLDTTGAAVVVSAAAPPSTGQVLTATSATAATWQTPLAITASAPADVTKAAAAVGVATTAARSDHKHDVSTASASSLSVGGSNTEGSASSLARSDHTHSLPAFGTGSGTFCQGDDARLSNDRTASGLRSASTIVVVSAATAPTAGQVLTATSSTAANWQTSAAGIQNSELWVPPTIPHVDDAEFTGSSLPSGWDVWRYETSAFQAPDAAAPALTATPGANVYRMAVGGRPSWVTLQAGTASGGGASRYALVSNVRTVVGADCTWRSRFKATLQGTGGFGDGFNRCQLFVGPVTAGNPHATDGVFLGFSSTGGTQTFSISQVGGAGGTSFNLTSSSIVNSMLCGGEFAIVKTGTTYYGYWFAADGTTVVFGSVTYAGTIGCYGIQFGNNTGTISGRSMALVDYVRREDTAAAQP